MAFSTCPECGESNYEEDDYSGIRSFDCGFESENDRRHSRCESKTRRRPNRPSVEPSDGASRYRLALLDAAQVAEILANDMAAEGASTEHVSRCRELALQMRGFAGHSGTGPVSFQDFTDVNTGSTSRVLAIIRRVKPW